MRIEKELKRNGARQGVKTTQCKTGIDTSREMDKEEEEEEKKNLPNLRMVSTKTNRTHALDRVDIQLVVLLVFLPNS